jgi:hypothetical protein
MARVRLGMGRGMGMPITNVMDLRALAKRRVPAAFFEYNRRRSHDEVTLHGVRPIPGAEEVLVRLDAARIREVEPQLQKLDPQQPFRPRRRPATRFANLRIERLDQRSRFRPGHDHLHIREKLCTPRRLHISLKSPRCLLLHDPARLKINDVSDSTGKSEFP